MSQDVPTEQAAVPEKEENVPTQETEPAVDPFAQARPVPEKKCRTKFFAIGTRDQLKASVTGTDTVTDPTLKEILDGILEQVRKEEFNLTSTNKNRIVTGMLLNHVDVQLENYKKECRKSKIQDIQRRYRVVERMFLQAEPVRAEDVAEEEQIDKSTVYRTLEKAYDDLAVLFFGIEGVKSIEVNRKTKKSGKKTMRNADTRNLANAKKAH